MPNYWYTLNNTKSTKDYPHREQHVIIGANSQSDVIDKVLNNILDTEREDRLQRLFVAVTDVTDVNDLKEYLPPQYQQYANNLTKLKEAMASLYEISQIYEISDVTLAPDCVGCIYDSPGQRDHMECPTGCLHEIQLCTSCM